MKRTLVGIISSLVLVVCVAGCASTRYRYGNQSFSSAQEALAKQKGDLDGILAAIQPTATPVHGKALVALPSREELRKHHVRLTGNLSAISSEAVDYICATLEADQEMLCHAIEKRGVFDQLTTVRVNEPAAASIGESDYLLYHDIDGWFLKGQKSAPGKVPLDASSAPGLPRTRTFLDSVEQSARGVPK